MILIFTQCFIIVFTFERKDNVSNILYFPRNEKHINFLRSDVTKEFMNRMFGVCSVQCNSSIFSMQVIKISVQMYV